MSDSGIGIPITPERELSRQAAIVGVGNTDYARDYRGARERGEGYRAPTAESLAETAFERALADSGLERRDIDGLSVSFLYGGADPPTLAKRLGIEPRHGVIAPGLMAGVIPPAVTALVSGQCDTIALVYAAASRAIGRKYGGQTYQNVGPSSYYYFHPWGWSSQAAHWALMFRHYQNAYGATEADLGSVALTLRAHAMANDNAIMRTPLSIDDYLSSRYIVRPLHLFDMCLVNDGGVCLIMRRTKEVSEAAHAAVLVAGWGDTAVKHSKMHYMVRERLAPQLHEAGRQALEMAGLSRSAVGHFEGYDASSIHLVNQVEGYGFVPAGEGLAACADGQLGIGGRLPTNTSGGMLSEAYMHGWNCIAEVVRQLRHEAGDRQITGLGASMSSVATTDSAHPLVFARGE